MAVIAFFSVCFEITTAKLSCRVEALVESLLLNYEIVKSIAVMISFLPAAINYRNYFLPKILFNDLI